MPWVVILNWIMSEARETRPIAVLKTLALCDEQRQNKSLQPSFQKHHPFLLQLQCIFVLISEGDAMIQF